MRWLIIFRPLLVILLVGGLGGCQAVYEVKVDAINDPRATKGVAYHLRTVPSAVPVVPASEIEKCVRAALGARGYFEAAEGVPAEQVVEVDYGVGPARLAYVYKPRDMLTIDLWGKEPPKGGAVPVEVREKYLRVTARSAAPRDGKSPAPEVWSVHLVVDDESKEFAPCLPALATVLVDYVGEHAESERTLRIREGDARKSVRALTK